MATQESQKYEGVQVLGLLGKEMDSTRLYTISALAHKTLPDHHVPL